MYYTLVLRPCLGFCQCHALSASTSTFQFRRPTRARAHVRARWLVLPRTEKRADRGQANVAIDPKRDWLSSPSPVRVVWRADGGTYSLFAAGAHLASRGTVTQKATHQKFCLSQKQSRVWERRDFEADKEAYLRRLVCLQPSVLDIRPL